MKRKLTVLAASDDRFLFSVMSSIHSVRAHLSGDHILDVWLYLDSVPSRRKKELVDFCSKAMADVHVQVVTEKEIFNSQRLAMQKVMGVRSNRWRVIFSRIFLPGIVAKDVERAIYIDADAIALKDLRETNEIPLREHPVGAVKALFSKMQQRLPAVPEYFNAGIMIFDLPKWRRFDLEAKCVEWLLNDDPRNDLADQDALNSVLCEMGQRKWEILDPSWNAIGLLSARKENTEYELPNLEEVRVLHYAGHTKPWAEKAHPLSSYFARHLREIPFSVPIDLRKPHSALGRAVDMYRRGKRKLGW